MSLYKNEKLFILRKLLSTEETLLKCDIPEVYLSPEDEQRRNASVLHVDHERYLKMAMRLDSNDPAILYRKKKEINCK